MLASGNENSLDTLDSFLASSRSMAESSGDPDFLRASEEAVRTVKRGLSRPFAITPDS
jgi:hypothetical protein